MGSIDVQVLNGDGQAYYTCHCQSDKPEGGPPITPAECQSARVSNVQSGPGTHTIVASAHFNECLNPASYFECPWSVVVTYNDGP